MSVPRDRREVLAGILAALAIPNAASAQATAKVPSILFICQFGTVKSPIARELLKRRAAARGIAIRVTARGITPEPHLPEGLRQSLAADGIDPAAEPLQQLAAGDISAADLTIIFDRLPSGLAPKALLNWSDLPSMINLYPTARVELDRRIDRLLDELAAAD